MHEKTKAKNELPDLFWVYAGSVWDFAPHFQNEGYWEAKCRYPAVVRGVGEVQQVLLAQSADGSCLD